MAKINSNEAKLSDRKVLFCREYVKDMHATKAATRAGYSARSASVQGSRLLKNDDILAYIDQLQANVARELGISHRYVLEKIKHGIEQCKNNPSALFKGLELLGKHLGTFERKPGEGEDRPAFVGITIIMGSKPSVKMISANPDGTVKDALRIGPPENVRG